MRNKGFWALLLCCMMLFGCARGETLVSLGDSLARGHGLEDASRRYSAQTAADLGMTEINLGVSGHLARETLEIVSENREQIQNADIILLSIGANHVLPVLTWAGDDSGELDMRLSGFETELCTLLDEIRKLAPEATVVLLTFYNPCRDGGYAPQQQASARLVCDRLNGVILSCAESYGCITADTAGAVDSYEGICLLSDGLHPDETGHRLIADCLLMTLENPDMSYKEP